MPDECLHSHLLTSKRTRTHSYHLSLLFSLIFAFIQALSSFSSVIGHRRHILPFFSLLLNLWQNVIHDYHHQE